MSTGGIINVVNHCAMGYVNKFKDVEVHSYHRYGVDAKMAILP